MAVIAWMGSVQASDVLEPLRSTPAAVPQLGIYGPTLGVVAGALQFPLRAGVGGYNGET